MLALLCFDLLALLLSFVAHLFVLSGLLIPRDMMAMVLNIGIAVAFGGRLFVTRQLRQGKDWILDKRLKNPRWLKTIMGVIITYGIAMCIFSLAGMVVKLSITMTEDDYVIASRKLFIGVFSLLIACYALEILAINSYRIFKNTEFPLNTKTCN
jgi:hypothetical protein